MMVVVPSFAVGEEPDDQVVAAGVVGIEVAVAPEVRDRVHRPGDVPHHDGANEHAPDQQAEAELKRVADTVADDQLADEARQKEDRPGRQHDPDPVKLAFQPCIERIPQEILGVFCRHAQTRGLAISQHQPSDMGPQEVDHRTMRVRLFVGMGMMMAMDGDPARGRVLHRAEAENGERMLEPLGTDKAAMRQQAMIAEADPQHPEHEQAGERDDHGGPAEQPGYERQQRQQMDDRDTGGIDPDDAQRARLIRRRQRMRVNEHANIIGHARIRRRQPAASCSTMKTIAPTRLGRGTAGACAGPDWPTAKPLQATTGTPRRGRFCRRGRSPGSRVVVVVRSSQGLSPGASVTLTGQQLAAYSCGGSPGIAPVGAAPDSLLASGMGPEEPRHPHLSG